MLTSIGLTGSMQCHGPAQPALALPLLPKMSLTDCQCYWLRQDLDALLGLTLVEPGEGQPRWRELAEVFGVFSRRTVVRPVAAPIVRR